MPLYLDIHRHDGDIQATHQALLEHQAKHDVRFLKHWHDNDQNVLFCLTRAPDAGAAIAAHKDAGHPPDEVHEVTEREAGPKVRQAAETPAEDTAESRAG